jgi:hypothetical protein
MARSVEGKGTLDDHILGYLAQQVVARRLIRARSRGEDDRRPPERRKVLHEAQRALNSA